MNSTIAAGRWELDVGTGILTLCRRSRKMFGLPAGVAGPIAEEEWLPRIHSEDIPAIRRAIRASLVEGTPYAERFRVLTPDGSLREIFGLGSVSGKPDCTARMVGWNVDVVSSASAARYAAADGTATIASHLDRSCDDDSDVLESADHLLEKAERILNIRRARGQMLGHAMLTGPAFDLFLTLYVLSAKEDSVTLSYLARVSGVSGTSTWRWFAYLVDKGLVTRSKSAVDRRAVSVRLTDLGRETLHKYLAVQ